MDTKFDQKDPIDLLFGLLGDTRFSPTRTRENAEKALNLMEELNISILCYLHCRGLVVFPDLLKRFLIQTNNKLTYHDLRSMICRCIEIKDGEKCESWRKESLDLLIKVNPQGDKCNLLLLREKYTIDLDLYNMVKNAGFTDPHFDLFRELKRKPYSEPLFEEWENKKGLYHGYREAYHLLQYSNDFSSIIERWYKYYFDCTFEAAEDYLHLKSEGKKDVVIQELRKLEHHRKN